jgi:endonuclease/exonuclease/phosphatase family metal-dependent hydrolase
MPVEEGYIVPRPAWLIRVFPALFLMAHLSARSPAAAPADSTRSEFVAVTLNIWHDQENWPARMAVIRDTLRVLGPDVVFLQEILQKEGLPNQAETLAGSLGYAWVFASVDPPGAPKRYGNAILTRHRIVETSDRKLEPLNDYRVALHTRLDVGGRTLDAYVTHLHHTLEGDTIRATQVADLLAFIDSTRAPGEALLLGGDLNAAPDTPELGPVRNRLTDAWPFVHPGEIDSSVTTLNVAKGHAPRVIDYLFFGPDRLRVVASEIFLDTPAADGLWASDHFGVWARFRWAGDR